MTKARYQIFGLAIASDMIFPDYIQGPFQNSWEIEKENSEIHRSYPQEDSIESIKSLPIEEEKSSSTIKSGPDVSLRKSIGGRDGSFVLDSELSIIDPNGNEEISNSMSLGVSELLENRKMEVKEEFKDSSFKLKKKKRKIDRDMDDSQCHYGRRKKTIIVTFTGIKPTEKDLHVKKQ